MRGPQNGPLNIVILILGTPKTKYCNPYSRNPENLLLSWENPIRLQDLEIEAGTALVWVTSEGSHSGMLQGLWGTGIL